MTRTYCSLSFTELSTKLEIIHSTYRTLSKPRPASRRDSFELHSLFDSLDSHVFRWGTNEPFKDSS